MGLLGSLIKTTVKTIGLAGSVGVDVLTGGTSMAIKDNGNTLTEDSYNSLAKELRKLSKQVDKL